MLSMTPLKWGENSGSQMKSASLSQEYLLSEGASNKGAALKYVVGAPEESLPLTTMPRLRTWIYTPSWVWME